MCGRFTLTASADVVADFFELADAGVLSPRYNIAPTQPAPVVRIDGGSGRRVLDHLHWGLVPYWADDPAIGSRMINARAETASTKPAFRSAFGRRRCLVVSDGFYEWQKQAGTKRKQPYYIRLLGGGPFAFAGLWEHWQGADGTALDSCTVLTTEPNELMKPLHNRMPVILMRKDHDLWLDPDLRDTAALEPLLRPYPPDEMTAFAVSTLVNSPANDTAACIEPVE